MQLKNKKIGILGLGEENFSLINYLSHQGAKITICDKKSKEELGHYFDKIKDLSFDFRLGENYLDNLIDFDIVMRTPGLSYLNPKIQEAKTKGVLISSQTKLFFELCPCQIIGVTGTKGKGTTSTLISEILENSKVNPPAGEAGSQKSKVYLGGNIGNAPIGFLNDLNRDDIVVLELSSFQLQDLEKSPHISVVLDVKTDHLDVHKNREEYVEAKKNIIKYQNTSDYAVINADYETSLNFSKETSAKVYFFSRSQNLEQGVYINDKKEIILKDEDKEFFLFNTSDVILRGEHNLENICAASLVTCLLGINPVDIRETVKSFPGLEHRLEFVGEFNGTKFYNDSFSTTPDTAIAAIKSFNEPIILIAGGSEKNANYTELGEVISNSTVKEVYTIGVTGPKIKEKITNQDIKIIDICQNLQEVMDLIYKTAISGDVVLLSPASASFGWFVNYKDRGNQFKDLVKEK